MGGTGGYAAKCKTGVLDWAGEKENKWRRGRDSPGIRPAPRVCGANPTYSFLLIWRRGRDSNPGYPLRGTTA